MFSNNPNTTVDLHVHSNCSDGTMSPAQLVRYAIEKGLAAFALTDHDTFDGFAQAKEAACNTSLEVIPGIEFSTVHLGSDVHIVGIDLNLEHPLLTAHMDGFRRSRDERNQKMCDRMRQEGFDISLAQMRQRFGDTVLTRAHFARYLTEKGYTATMKEAFSRYIGEGCPYYIAREKITPHEVVRLVDQAGGIPILAHPMLITLSHDKLHQLIQELIPEGLIGIEAIYSTYSLQEEQYVRNLAKEYHLTLSGGSDFHGSNKPGLDLGTGYDGKLSIPYSILDNLRTARRLKNEQGK